MIAEPNGTDGHRASLSPVLIHFVAPHGKLYQRLLTLEQLLGNIPPIAIAQRHTQSAYRLKPLIGKKKPLHESGYSYQRTRRRVRKSGTVTTPVH